MAVIGAGGRFIGANPAYTTLELNETYDLCGVTFVVVEQDLLEEFLPEPIKMVYRHPKYSYLILAI